MKAGIVLIGLILIAIGAIYITGFYLPYLTPLIYVLFELVPINGVILSIVILIVGLIVLIAGLKASKMGKYYNYYGN